MEKASWKDKVIAEEYARESAGAKYRADNTSFQKSARFRYLEFSHIGAAAVRAVFTRRITGRFYAAFF